MIQTPRQQDRFTRVMADSRIQEMLAQVPALQHIFEQATSTGGLDNPWQRYDDLKREGQHHVDGLALRSTLPTNVYHEAFTWALTELLPSDEAFERNRPRARDEDEEA